MYIQLEISPENYYSPYKLLGMSGPWIAMHPSIYIHATILPENCFLLYK
jgi:hypothetical protein